MVIAAAGYGKTTALRRWCPAPGARWWPGGTDPAAFVVDAAAAGDGPIVLDDLAAIDSGGKFEAQFVQQCLRDCEACLQGLDLAGQQGRWDALRDQAHALKGVAGNLGLARVVETSGEILRMPQAQLAGEWRRHASALRERMAEGRTALDARARERRARDESESG